MKCAVSSCKNESGNKNTKLSFFSFPKEKKLLKKWVRFCGKDIKVFNTKSSRICMEHFKADEIEGQLKFDMGLSSKRLLKSGVVPSIYGNEYPKPSDIYRLDRLHKRNNRKIVASLLLEAESLKAEDNQIQVKNEPEVDQFHYETNSFMANCQESSSFSTNSNPQGILVMECNEDKSKLEEQVQTLQKEVKIETSENFEMQQNLLSVEKKLSYEIANLKEPLLKNEFECKNIEEKRQEILKEGIVILKLGSCFSVQECIFIYEDSTKK